MKSDQSQAANESSRKLTRKPVILAAAALIATSALGLTLGNIVPFAAAETATQPTIDTPYGRAPLTFADLVAKVSPAVVSINVKGDAKVADNDQIPGLPDLPEDNPLYDFFKQFRKNMPQHEAKPHPMLAQGSGFFISPDGFVVTNNHVVEDAEDITVTLENGDKFPAKLIGTDPRTDVALIKVNAEGKTFPFVEFETKDPRVGDWVLAVGNPFGLGGTVTAGIISAHNRDIGSGPYDYLQIDAAVNRGNSGGPSFDLDGKGSSQVHVEYQGVRSNTVSVNVARTAPGVFTQEGSTGRRGLIYGDTWILNSAANPAPKGSLVTIIWTGGGQTNPDGVDGRIENQTLPRPVAPVTVSIGGQKAELVYAGAVPFGWAGLLMVQAKVPAGVASGDALLLFDRNSLDFSRRGLTALANYATPEEARKHGVFCIAGDGELRVYLQKPSPKEQMLSGAIDASGRTLLDLGVMSWDAETSARWFRIFQIVPDENSNFGWSGGMKENILRHGLDLYREICCAMESARTFTALLPESFVCVRGGRRPLRVAHGDDVDGRCAHPALRLGGPGECDPARPLCSS